MASTSPSLRISITLQSCRKPLFPTTLTTSFRPRQLPSRSAGLSCSSRRRDGGNPSLTPKKSNKKKIAKKEVGEDEDMDEDAFEALFRQLEEDLKKDGLDGEDDDDDVSEEDLAKLEKELAEALEDDDFLVALGSAALGGVVNEDEDDDENEDDEEEEEEDEGEDIDVTNNVDGDEVDDDDDEEEEMPVKLKNWQLRRLAYALKDGRRKTSIKNLAADLCLDRAVVLKLLRDPPPNLVMLSATLPDKPAKTVLDPVRKLEEAAPLETAMEAAKPEVEVKEPVHVMQSNWSARKRLKKVQIETLEEVYRRSKRPTNAMISSIVHVTNLPRKRVVKWFEDKRGEDGVPEQRRPYEPRASESVITS
ncbi:protein OVEREXPRESSOR OF CATIONIC PEROXIDASE 3 isoform X1 [Salvia miltiorrhiza]|uniref:protein OVEREXPRESSOR OF CATIONIC PEROXIDASE 3 isoform X1 n=1 Tax=Salvia miltiorrhiza TaxID=226208 RepID=UPI0025AC793E|nr:protein OVEREXPRESSOR OF CATIONIC PEROXIDASE 3 isoform X1 [Salvia miltiorrhiza]